MRWQMLKKRTYPIWEAYPLGAFWKPFFWKFLECRLGAVILSLFLKFSCNSQLSISLSPPKEINNHWSLSINWLSKFMCTKIHHLQPPILFQKHKKNSIKDDCNWKLKISKHTLMNITISSGQKRGKKRGKRT